MLEHLPKDVRDSLAMARNGRLKKRSRLRVHVGDVVHPILRFWETGFALDAATAPHLRGLVDVFDGSRHILQCLIVASAEADGEVVCDYKWSRLAVDQAPRDFAPDEGAPIGLLPRA